VVLTASGRSAVVAAVALAAAVTTACSPIASLPASLPTTPSPAASRTALADPTRPAMTAPTATSTPARTGGSATADPEGYIPVVVPASAITTVELPAGFGFHRLDSDGPLVVLDQVASVSPAAGRSIYLVDLANATMRTLTDAPSGYTVWAPAISGSVVAWLEWHYEGQSDTGACDWRIRVEDVSASGLARTVASGVQRRAGTGFGASWPALDLDGDRVVYAIEDPSAAPDGWQIIVRTLAGDVLKTIHVPEPVYDLAASDGAIAWTEGRTDPKLGYTTATHLFVAQGSATTGTELASDAYEVALDAGRLVWTKDSPGGQGAAIGTRMWSTSLDSLAPMAVSPPPGQGTEQLQEWPATGDGIVTWGSARVSMADPTQNGDRLGVWSPTTAHAVEIHPTPGAILSGAGGGWVVWVDYRSDPPTVSGITDQVLGLP